MNEQLVVRVSCGAASAVAWDIAIKRYGAEAIDAVNAFVTAEHPDNRRFLADCENWIGTRVTVLRDEKYAADPFNVWFAKRFIANQKGAPCSRAIKGEILDRYRPGLPIVLGFTAEETKRLDRFIDANPDKRVIAPLIENGIDKDECKRRLQHAGLTLPVPYQQGFDNSNCIDPGCPKGGLAYWKHIDRHYPTSYERVIALQDNLGPGSWFLSDRRGGNRTRLSLRMLREIDEPSWRMEDEPPISCGGSCEWEQFDLFERLGA